MAYANEYLNASKGTFTSHSHWSKTSLFGRTRSLPVIKQDRRAVDHIWSAPSLPHRLPWGGRSGERQ